MKLSPLDIRKQEFTRRFRGYDPDEVQAFLQALSAQWEGHLDDIRRQEERVRDLENKLQHYERVEEALQEALQTARESSRQALQAAEQKAHQIRSQAEIDADRIKHDAEQDRSRLRQETQSILGRRKEIVSRLRAFLLTEMEMLAHFDGDDPIGYIKLMPADRRQLDTHDDDDDEDDAYDVLETSSVVVAAAEASDEPPAAGDETLGERLLRLDDEAALPAEGAGRAEGSDAEKAPAPGFWVPGQGLQDTPAPPEAAGEAPPVQPPGPPSPAPAHTPAEEPRAAWRQRPFFEAAGAAAPEPPPQPTTEAPSEPADAPPTTAEDEIARIRRILQDLE